MNLLENLEREKKKEMFKKLCVMEKDMRLQEFEKAR